LAKESLPQTARDALASYAVPTEEVHHPQADRQLVA